MKAEINGSNLCISIADFADEMPDEFKQFLMKDAAFSDMAIHAVVARMTGEPAFDGGWNIYPDSVAEQAREALLDHMPKVANKLIRQLIKQRDVAKAEAKRMNRAYWELHHAIPDGLWALKPKMPDYVYTPEISKEEADELLESGND